MNLAGLARFLARHVGRPFVESVATGPRTRRYTLADLPASGSAGLQISEQAYALALNPGSHGAAALEVSFDPPGASEARWTPLVAPSKLTRPDGRAFSWVVVRRRANTPAGSQEVLLDFDPGELGSTVMHESSRGPNVNPSGSADVRQRIVLADGTEVDVEGAGGSAATRGAPGVSFWDTTGAGSWIRALGTAAGRLAVSLIAGQEGISGGAGAVGAATPRVTLASDDPAVTSLQIMDDWDEADRARVNAIVGQAGVAADAGAPGANTVRTVEATPAAFVHGRTNAGTTATLILGADTGRAAAYLKNFGAATVYVGGPAVTTATGFPLEPGDSMPVGSGAAVYAIVAAGTEPVAYWSET